MSLEKGGSPGGNTKSRSQNNALGPAKLGARSFGGGRGGGSEPERLCLGPTALAGGEAKGLPVCCFQALSRAPSMPRPHPLALELSMLPVQNPVLLSTESKERLFPTSWDF